MRARTRYILRRLDANGLECFANTTSRPLAETILRACERKAAPDTLYDIEETIDAPQEGAHHGS
jgi:hypothetical protein